MTQICSEELALREGALFQIFTHSSPRVFGVGRVLSRAAILGNGAPPVTR